MIETKTFTENEEYLNDIAKEPQIKENSFSMCIHDHRQNP